MKGQSADEACGGSKFACGFVIDLYGGCGDVRRAILSTANGLALSSRDQNGAIREQGCGMSVTRSGQVSSQGPCVGGGVVEFRQVHGKPGSGAAGDQDLTILKQGTGVVEASGSHAGGIRPCACGRIVELAGRGGGAGGGASDGQH